MINSNYFLDKAKKVVADYFNEHVDKSQNIRLRPEFDVYVVWFCKTLKNWKALISTDALDGIYYEVTYDGDKDQIYLDVYKKWENVCIPGKMEIEVRQKHDDRYPYLKNDLERHFD